MSDDPLDDLDDDLVDDDLKPGADGHADADTPDPDAGGGVREAVADAQPERPETEYSTLGTIAGTLVANLPKPAIGVRETMFKRMAKKSLENYYKASGGDAIAINARPGQQIALDPVVYRSPEEIEEGESPGWKAKGREKTWHPATEGNTVNYLGRTPTILLEDDSHVEAGWLAPRIGEAIELDNYWPVFTDATINAVVDAPAAGNGRARADGGIELELELESPGQWAQDNIVDLGSGDGYDGMRISTRKAREWQAESTDSEHMQMQEDRGFLRGLANAEEGPGIVKLLLICAGIILGVLAIVLLGPEIISGGGGGGSSLPSLLAGFGVA